jgi:hypothetical protein
MFVNVLLGLLFLLVAAPAVDTAARLDRILTYRPGLAGEITKASQYQTA